MRKFLLLTPLLILLAGCGNQMMRQPAFKPLDTPRAASPAAAIPFSPGPPSWDAAPRTAAFGDNAGQTDPAGSAMKEPVLPGPNLSDMARQMAAPRSVDNIRNPLVTSSTVIHSGRTIFMNRCVQCHNASGHGMGPIGGYLAPPPPDLAASITQKRSDGAIFWQITMGQGKMPGFRHWTTPAQRWSLVAYVRSLKNGGAPPADARRTDYPVYGSIGFETGDPSKPFKELPAAGNDMVIRRNLEATQLWRNRWKGQIHAR
ncbi:hypothetical protein CCAX7_61340 [Capsulimonas corticalis]|uniref:Uncharacterized protein n=1 Tax=Capsulimonas corticalis TaxID=2219043 RepID=A0A402CWA7_9BACT|nr:cytochrome c [Capsulimonas corticalis]BDI34083.1 hypothetical protein CCAX7_61340 [Capsulimonas corticalis]